MPPSPTNVSDPSKEHPSSQSTPTGTTLSAEKPQSQNPGSSLTDPTLDSGLPVHLPTPKREEKETPTEVSTTSGSTSHSPTTSESSAGTTTSPTRPSSSQPPSSHSVAHSSPAPASTSSLTSPTTSQKPAAPVGLMWDQRDITHGQGMMRCMPAKCVYPCDAGITLDINLCPVCLCRSALSLPGTK